MSDWSKLRATLTTALAWAVPWGILSGSLLVSFEILNAPRNLSLGIYLRDGPGIFIAGALNGAFVGAIAGGIFAWRLRAWARDRASENLSLTQTARMGAVSGAAAAAAPMLLWAIAGGRPPLVLLPMVLLVAAAGAGSAYAMLAMARRSAPLAASPLGADSLEERDADVGELGAAQSEVERLLIERSALKERA